MNHRYQITAGAALLTLLFAITPAQAQHEGHGHDHGAKNASAMPLCPVMGEPINFAVSAKTDDGPVYFCCKMCVKKFNKDPKKYAKGVAEQRKMLANRPKIQVTCPVTREAVDAKFSIEHAGQKVLFCCSDCIGKFGKNPKKYEAALANSYTYQTECPVMAEEIDPQSFTTLASGMKVYFCCPGCEKKLYGNPAKYLPNLEAQGFTINAKDVKPADKDENHADHDDDHDHDHDHDHGSHGHGG